MADKKFREVSIGSSFEFPRRTPDGFLSSFTGRVKKTGPRKYEGVSRHIKGREFRVGTIDARVTNVRKAPKKRK